MPKLTKLLRLPAAALLTAAVLLTRARRPPKGDPEALAAYKETTTRSSR